MAGITTIKLSKKTKERLAELGRKGETYEEIIKKMLDFYASMLREKELKEEIEKAAEFAERDEAKGAELVADLSNALIKVVPKEALVDKREEERRLMKMLSWR
jgi:predicted nucleic acid-binding protein